MRVGRKILVNFRINTQNIIIIIIIITLATVPLFVAESSKDLGIRTVGLMAVCFPGVMTLCVLANQV